MFLSVLRRTQEMRKNTGTALEGWERIHDRMWRGRKKRGLKLQWKSSTPGRTGAFISLIIEIYSFKRE